MTPPVRERPRAGTSATATTPPVRVVLRRRVLRRAAWLAVDLVAITACVVLVLHG